ncbi:amidase [Thermodesulfobacteriota bacterium]
MKLDEYVRYDGLGLAGLIRDREIRPKELLETVRQGIEAVNPEINAVVDVYEDQLAKVSSEQMLPGPFYGVPFMLKDLVLMEKGRSCESGSLLGKGFIGSEDSFLSIRYRNAGLVIYGRTASAEMGYSFSTETRLHGITRNPWNPERIAGGSSGGAGAAVAAGILPMAHGNDAAGSIRVPSACCGVFGLKPSRGRISNGPSMSEVVMGLATEHALTRSVRDSAALLDISHGYEPGDPYIIQRPARPYVEEVKTPPGRLRIAFSSKAWSGVAIEKENLRALEETVKLCEELGHEMVEAAPKLGVDWDEFNDACMKAYIISFSGFAQFLCMATAREPSEKYLPHMILATLEEASKLTITDIGLSEMVFNKTARSIAQFFEHYDIFLTPTLARRARPVGSLDMNDQSLTPLDWHELSMSFSPFTMVWNVTGQPAMSVPLYESRENMPIGMQFVTKLGDEYLLFRLAGQLEQALPWAQRNPPIHVLNRLDNRSRRP